MFNSTPLSNNAIIELINTNIKRFDYVPPVSLDDVMPVVHAVLEQLSCEVLPDLRNVHHESEYGFNFPVPHAAFIQAIKRHENRTGFNLLEPSDKIKLENVVRYIFAFTLGAIFGVDEVVLSKDMNDKLMTSADGREYSYTISLPPAGVGQTLVKLLASYTATVEANLTEQQQAEIYKRVDYIKARADMIHDLANENQAVNQSIVNRIDAVAETVESGFKAVRKLVKRINNSIVGKLSK